MKKWNRWQDWVTVAAGIFAAVSVLWTTQQGLSTTLMLFFGVLLIVTGLVNLAIPGTPVMEWVQAVFAAGLLLTVDGVLREHRRSCLDSWITGAVALVVTAAAIKPSTEGHHRIRTSH